MKRFPNRILPVVLVSICLAVAACGSGGSGGSNNGAHSTATTGSVPTATPANQATNVPVASVAECGKLLSLSEANQATNPPSPATTIFPLNVSGDALCYYETSTHLTIVAMIFKGYSGGTISAGIEKSFSGSTGDFHITNSQSVSGIGDQAEYVTLTGTSTSNGVTVNATENILFVVDGKVVYGLINIIYAGVDPLGSASSATVLSDFEQIARLVDSRL